MLEELNAVAKELDQFRKSTNTKMSYPKVIQDKVVSLLDKEFPFQKYQRQQVFTAPHSENGSLDIRKNLPLSLQKLSPITKLLEVLLSSLV